MALTDCCNYCMKCTKSEACVQLYIFKSKMGIKHELVCKMCELTCFSCPFLIMVLEIIIKQREYTPGCVAQ